MCRSIILDSFDVVDKAAKRFPNEDVKADTTKNMIIMWITIKQTCTDMMFVKVFIVVFQLVGIVRMFGLRS